MATWWSGGGGAPADSRHGTANKIAWQTNPCGALSTRVFIETPNGVPRGEPAGASRDPVLDGVAGHLATGGVLRSAPAPAVSPLAEPPPV